MANSIARNSRASIYLDMARGLAAIEVMMYHIRPTLLVPYADIKHKNILDLLLYGITDKGFQAVMVFFVLSGFFISSSVIHSMTKGTWSWKKYLTNRLTRLWLVLIPALVLTYAWNQLNIAVYANRGVTGDMGWLSFLKNIFFLQGTAFIRADSYGGNGALWSLTYEFWYYILFPCLMLVFCSRRPLSKLIYAIVTVGICVLVGKVIISYFVVWLLGSALAALPKIPKATEWKIPLLSFGFLLFFIALGLSKRNNTYPSDLSIGFTFAMVAYMWLSTYETKAVRNTIRYRLSTMLASFSYTLYLVHFPVNNFLVSWIHNRQFQPNLKSYSVILAVFLGVIAYAWVISQLTEARTDKVRLFIGRVLNRANLLLNQRGKSATSA